MFIAGAGLGSVSREIHPTGHWCGAQSMQRQRRQSKTGRVGSYHGLGCGVRGSSIRAGEETVQGLSSEWRAWIVMIKTRLEEPPRDLLRELRRALGTYAVHGYSLGWASLSRTQPPQLPPGCCCQLAPGHLPCFSLGCAWPPLRLH